MNVRKILSCCDHTCLSQTATWDDIRRLCDEGIQYRTASVCIPPSYVARAKKYVGDRLNLCTVVGFPNGYQTTAVKALETAEAIESGADEIDMVVNLGDVRDGRDEDILREIRLLKALCGRRVLKVIVETCLLDDNEKCRLCRLVTEAGADYIKTSTGFSRGGATPEDVALLRAHVGQNVKVKAAGGIADLHDAEQMIAAGADRLGSSRIVGIVRTLCAQGTLSAQSLAMDDTDADICECGTPYEKA